MNGPSYSVRTGSVFIRNFDQGVVETMGGYIDTPTDPFLVSALGNKKNYFIDMNLINEQGSIVLTKVPVIFGNPEPIKKKKIYPSFLVFRQDPVLALHRWQSVGQMEYRIPSTGAVLEEYHGVSGYSAYEQKMQDDPYDITYQIQVYARIESHAIPMIKKVLSVYRPYSKLLLKDSLGDDRSYNVYQETVSDISELIDVVDRMKGYVATIRVEGELTLTEPITLPTVSSFSVSGGVMF